MINIYIQIASLNIKISFSTKIHPIYRKTIIGNIKKWLYPFILQIKKSPHTNIIFNFVKQKPWEIIKSVKKNTHRSFRLFYEFQDGKYIVNYHESVFNFLFLLRRALQDLFYTNGNGFFIHASACIYRNRLYLFTARPGGGKSTILKLFSKIGAIPLVDDTGIIIKNKNKYYYYQTPFIETNQIKIKTNKNYTIKAIFFLKKSENNHIEPITDKLYLFRRLGKQLLIRNQLSSLQVNTLFSFISKNKFYFLAFSNNRLKFKKFLDSSEFFLR